jgi:hypothetical protein
MQSLANSLSLRVTTLKRKPQITVNYVTFKKIYLHFLISVCWVWCQFITGRVSLFSTVFYVLSGHFLRGFHVKILHALVFSLSFFSFSLSFFYDKYCSNYDFFLSFMFRLLWTWKLISLVAVSSENGKVVGCKYGHGTETARFTAFF